MISIDNAIEIIRDNIPEKSRGEISIETAAGRYLAEDILAPESSPRFTNSAMDGFAVRWKDVQGASPEDPVGLHIVGESQAGKPFESVIREGEAIRISTGAKLCEGCDTIIRVEDTAEEEGRAIVLQAKKQGQDVRYLGEEFTEGSVLLGKGKKISAPQVALLASVGVQRVKVYNPCDVTVLVTGSELTSLGENVGEGQIRDSNMIMLCTAIKEAGGRVKKCLQVPDDPGATRQAIADAGADIILCTGGISVGRHDHVKEAALGNQFESLFWRIRQKPGKPLYFARKGKVLLFGLPGNPVSAFMCFTHYVRPLITTYNGMTYGWPKITGEALAGISNSGKRTNMVRVKLSWRESGGYCITDAAKQGSHMLTSLSDSDGYIILEPGRVLAQGERVNVYGYSYLREPV